MVNKVLLVGNLGADPEVHVAESSGQTIAGFRIATDRRWRDEDGETQQATQWHNVVCFGLQAELASDHLTRGQLVLVEGRLQTRSWTDETQTLRYRTDVVCRYFRRLTSSGSRPRASEAL